MIAATNELSVENVTRILSKHVPLYRTITPIYQTMMLKSLRELWDPPQKRMLDVGGGTGVIAQAVKELFSIEVTSVDVQDRYLKSLDIETRTFDGLSLPFADQSFDCVMLNNVLHHVPSGARPGLLRECARVAGPGPVYIKDHLAQSALDRLRLVTLDALGNVPFGGMIEADYLGRDEWRALAAAAGFRIDACSQAQYRRGLFATFFPNRLEITMRWLPDA